MEQVLAKLIELLRHPIFRDLAKAAFTWLFDMLIDWVQGVLDSRRGGAATGIA